MKIKRQTDKQSISSNNEFVGYDEKNRVEIWRTPSGKLVNIEPISAPEMTSEISSEFQNKNSGFKVLDSSPVLRVDEVEYRGSTPTGDHVPEYFKFKGLVKKPDGGVSSIDFESNSSMTMAEITALILG